MDKEFVMELVKSACGMACIAGILYMMFAIDYMLH